MIRRRFVRHPRRYAGHRPIGLRNYDQLSATAGVLPDNEHDLAATGMERVVNPPLYRVLAGSMSLLRVSTEGRCFSRRIRLTVALTLPSEAVNSRTSSNCWL